MRDHDSTRPGINSTMLSLRDDLASYCRDAIALINEAIGKAPELATITFYRFAPNNVGGFDGIEERRPDWHRIVRSLGPQVQSLPSYARAREALLAEPVLSNPE